MKKLFVILLFILTVNTVYSKNVQTFSGNFRSLRGVMNSLSCYCYNGGYLTYGKGQIISVCFKDNEKVEDGFITVRGYLKKITLKSRKNSPCSAGSKNIFIVTSYKRGYIKETLTQNREWEGQWTTRYGIISMKFLGNKLTGVYPKGRVTGTIIKTRYGSEIRGKWFQPKNKGWFSFTKYNNMKNFIGIWGYSNNRNKIIAAWNGNRPSHSKK